MVRILHYALALHEVVLVDNRRVLRFSASLDVMHVLMKIVDVDDFSVL